MNKMPIVSSDKAIVSIQFSLAQAMVGRFVGLVNRRKKFIRGQVSAVASDRRGKPRVVVDGARYDLSQILTVTPFAFN
jgi:hypothetical protein